MKILLVEDDAELAIGVAAALQPHGLHVACARSVSDALIRLDQHSCDLLVLDLGLPDGDGLELLRHVRRGSRALPVMVLSARDYLDSKVAALDMGADDYLIKPFAVAELLSRIKALARRSYGFDDERLEVRGLCIELSSRSVTVHGAAVELTTCEFQLLCALVMRAGRVVTRRVLEEQSLPGGQILAGNSLGVHMANLRRKLGDHYIRTVRGVGYMVPLADAAGS